MQKSLKLSISTSILTLLALIPLLPWLTLKPLAERFATADLALSSLSQVSALVGTVLFALYIISQTNSHVVRYFFGEKKNLLHSALSNLSFLLLMTHPLVLLIKLLPSGAGSTSLFHPSLALDFGIYALLLLVSLYISRFFATRKNQLLKSAPLAMTSILFLGTFHAFFIPSSLSESFFIKSYILGIVTVAIVFQMHNVFVRIADTVQSRRRIRNTI
jgi:hypothetical protein